LRKTAAGKGATLDRTIAPIKRVAAAKTVGG
jgi:hypothetical protein